MTSYDVPLNKKVDLVYICSTSSVIHLYALTNLFLLNFFLQFSMYRLWQWLSAFVWFVIRLLGGYPSWDFNDTFSKDKKITIANFSFFPISFSFSESAFLRSKIEKVCDFLKLLSSYLHISSRMLQVFNPRHQRCCCCSCTNMPTSQLVPLCKKCISLFYLRSPVSTKALSQNRQMDQLSFILSPFRFPLPVNLLVIVKLPLHC